MHDQADELRQLVLRTAVTSRQSESPPPPLIVVYGGKGGVGATTIAVNLAVSIASEGRRVVLADADFHQPDATTLCGLKDGNTVADVFSGRRTVHEVLQPGPAGVLVLPGAWAPARLTDCSPLAQQRLLEQLARLGPHADAIVLDVGNGPGPLSRRFWQAADLVALVTTTDAASVMDSYAAIKLLADRDAPRQILTVANMAIDEPSAQDIQSRIHAACQRFLDVNIRNGPFIPFDRNVSVAAEQRRPFVLTAADTPAASAVDLLREQILELVHQAASSRRHRDPAAA